MKKLMLLLTIVAMLSFSVSAKEKQKTIKVNAPIKDLTTQEVVGYVAFKTSGGMFDVDVDINDGKPDALVAISVTTDRAVFHCIPIFQQYKIEPADTSGTSCRGAIFVALCAEQVTQFVTKLPRISFVQGLQHLIALLEQVFPQRGVSLLSVPGAAIGCPQPGDNFHQGIKLVQVLR